MKGDQQRSEEIWLRTDELNEAIKALELVQELLPRVVNDSYYWKWVIVALHNSLQGFMVCALQGSSKLNVLPDGVAAKWLEAYRGGSDEIPKQILDTFPNLYKKIKSERMIMYTESKKFVAKGQQDLHVRKLNRLRNQFIHYTPLGWSLEVSDLPAITRDCVEVIKFLALESWNILYREEQTRQDVEHLINMVQQSIEEIQKTYGP